MRVGPVQKRAPELVFGFSLASSAALLLYFAHKVWFFGDDWDFLLERGVRGHSELGLFAPHNEHWSTVPILVNRMLFSVFGVRHYLPYAAVVIVLHLAITWTMWSLLRRHGVRPWPATAFGALLAVGGAGAENTLWDFQVGFLLPVLCALLALRWMAPSRRPDLARDGAVVALLVLGLMSSGQGIVAVIVVSAFAWLTRSAWMGAFFAVVGGVVYLSWYLPVGHSGLQEDGVTLRSIGAMPEYLWTGLSNVWSATPGVPQAGLLVIALAVASLLHEGSRRPPYLELAVAGVLGALAMFALAGTTRAQLGVAQSLSSRYVYIAGVLTTPVVAAGTQRVLVRARSRQVEVPAVCAAVMTLALISSVNSLSSFTDYRRRLLAGVPERIVGAWQLVHAHEPLLVTMPDPSFTSNVTESRLNRLSRSDLPDLGRNVNGVLDAAGRMQVDVRAERFTLPTASAFTATGLPIGRADLATGCVKGRTTASFAYVDFLVPAGGLQVRFATSDKHVGTQLLRGTQASPVVDRPTGVGQTRYVGATAAGDTLRIVFPSATSYELCPA